MDRGKWNGKDIYFPLSLSFLRPLPISEKKGTRRGMRRNIKASVVIPFISHSLFFREERGREGRGKGKDIKVRE